MQKKHDDQSRTLNPSVISDADQAATTTEKGREGMSEPRCGAVVGRVEGYVYLCGYPPGHTGDHKYDPPLIGAPKAPSDPVTDDEMAEAMRTLGGSFVQRLGKAWCAADAINRAKILATWPEYVKEWELYT